MTLKVGWKNWNIDTCLLWRLNETDTDVVIIYVYDILEIGDKPEFMDTV